MPNDQMMLVYLGPVKERINAYRISPQVNFNFIFKSINLFASLHSLRLQVRITYAQRSIILNL